MIDAISNPSQYVGGGGVAATSKSKLGKEDFLSLLVAQLKNQDPLSPLQPHEFAAQLAQFSSVEQLASLNEAVMIQSEMSQLVALLGKTSFGASLIGRQVLAADNQVTVTASKPTEVRVEIGGNGGKAKLLLKDKAGRVVETRELGNLGPGLQTVKLPGDLPPGDYRYSIEVQGPGDTKVPVQTFTTGVVKGVVLKDGVLVLQVGSLEIPLDAVTEIVAGPTGAAT